MRRQLVHLYRLLLTEHYKIQSCGIDDQGIVIIVLAPPPEKNDRNKWKIYLQPNDLLKELERKRQCHQN